MSTVITRKMTDKKIITTRVTVRETDRIIQFEDILDAVTVEYDEWFRETPWDNCDGWEHDYERVGYSDHVGIRDSRGYGWSGANRESFLITISDDQIEEWGNYDYYRARGCSKQVTAELVAQVKRDSLDQLVKWHSDGWNWYTTAGDYEGYVASYGGIDCPDHAEEMRYEIAGEIAANMEVDGYIVEGEHNPHTYDKLAAAKDHFRRNLQLDVVKGR